MRIVERKHNFQDLLNWAAVIGWTLLAASQRFPFWPAVAIYGVLFLLINYKLSSVAADVGAHPQPAQRSYHRSSFWILVLLGAYAAWVFAHWGWLFWFVVFGSAVGAFVATFLRSKARA